MKIIWTRIWISVATVLIVAVTLVLIVALHVAKITHRIWNVIFNRRLMTKQRA